MSLEAKLETLTAAINCLAAAISGAKGNVLLPPAAAVIPAPAQVPVQITAPVTAPVTAAPAPAAAAPAMPAPPTFAPPMPPPIAAPAGVPFTDGKGLIAYTMDAYKALGPVKGGQIQKVLQDCGSTNINDLPIDKYAAFYKGVEALKV